MESRSPDEALELYRNGYLKLWSALHDRTTGLPSYPYLFDSIRSWLDTRKHVGVVHIEIANLDLVESLYGWQVFDRILARASSCLQTLIGTEIPEGTLLAVNGVAGDRFVAFVPSSCEGTEVDTAIVSELGVALEARLEAAFDHEDFASLSPKLSFRSGHALVSENPFYRFERRVHAAVEEAHTLHSRRESRRERVWESAIRRIIREASILTVFQPVVDLVRRRVIGHEAFARGPRETAFEMPQAMFAHSGRLGTAIALDRLCRRTALREFGLVSGRRKIFLNVLPACLADPDWQNMGVAGSEESASVAPEEVVIEVGERAFDSQPEEVALQFQRLKALGFGLALDDVGTGYSSLATLEHLKPDYLKVDLTLVRDVHLSLIKQELLRVLVQIGNRVGAAVVAEGVESEEEAAVLTAAGARYGQGYLFAGPEPPSSGGSLDRVEELDN